MPPVLPALLQRHMACSYSQPQIPPQVASWNLNVTQSPEGDFSSIRHDQQVLYRTHRQLTACPSSVFHDINHR